MHIIQFRESNPPGWVEVYLDGSLVFRSREYKTSAEWAKHRYSMDDAQLRQAYADYRTNY